MFVIVTQSTFLKNKGSKELFKHTDKKLFQNKMKKLHINAYIHSFFPHAYMHLQKERASDAVLLLAALHFYQYLWMGR